MNQIGEAASFSFNCILSLSGFLFIKSMTVWILKLKIFVNVITEMNTGEILKMPPLRALSEIEIKAVHLAGVVVFAVEIPPMLQVWPWLGLAAGPSFTALKGVPASRSSPVCVFLP